MSTQEGEVIATRSVEKGTAEAALERRKGETILYAASVMMLLRRIGCAG